MSARAPRAGSCLADLDRRQRRHGGDVRLVDESAGGAAAGSAGGAARLMLLGGAPMDGPRTVWWNFVSSRPERIEASKADWKAGRFPRVAGDDEFIPLPEG